MTYIYIRYKNGATSTCDIDQLAITSSFVKIYTERDGIINIPKHTIDSLDVIIGG